MSDIDLAIQDKGNSLLSATSTTVPLNVSVDATGPKGDTGATGPSGVLTTATFTTNGSVKQTVYNVRDYGAVGDGVTDDYTAINNTIIAANAGGGGVILFSAGTYMISQRFILSNCSNLHFKSQGKYAATIKIIPANLSNFGFRYMFTTNGSGSTSLNITLDGLKLDGSYNNTANTGGGINPGYYWKIIDCWTYNFNYFPIWIDGNTNSTKIINHRFSGQSNGTDNIGGGGSAYVEISGCIYESDCTGNAWDNVGGTYIYYHHNEIKGNNSIFIEAMQYVEAHDNIFVGSGSIGVHSDKNYGPTSITNARYIKVHDNFLLGGGNINNSTDTDPVKSTTVGGDIEIYDNYILSPTNYGILLKGGTDDVTRWGNNYRVTGNTVINANASNSTTANIGTGIVNPSAINIAQGIDILVANNICDDNRVTPQQIYGIQVGQTFSPSANSEPNAVTLIGNHINGVVTAKVNRVSSTYTTDYSNITDGNLPVIAPVTLTAASASNIVPLTIVQNDATNNPDALDITNNGTGITAKILTSGNVRRAYIGNQGSNTGIDTSDHQFSGNHADSIGIATLSQRSSTGSGVVLNIQNLGTGDSLRVKGGVGTGSDNDLIVKNTGNIGMGTASPNSVLQVAGPIATSYNAQTTTYAILATDSVVDCTSGTFTVTLPTAVGIAGRQYTVKNSGTGVITVATTSTQTIDGGSTATLSVRYVSITVVSDGANWKVI